jgi:hypothetical protein
VITRTYGKFPDGDFGTGIGLVTTNGLATATGEDRRAAGQTCPLLLVALGGESCGETVVWQDAPPDSRAVRSGGIAKAVAAEKSIHSRRVRKGV